MKSGSEGAPEHSAEPHILESIAKVTFEVPEAPFDGANILRILLYNGLPQGSLASEEGPDWSYMLVKSQTFCALCC